MSVPLPQLPMKTTTSGRFLDPDERYEVYQVKAAERPHLLGVYHDSDDENDESSDDDISQYDPPLVDGCDIPAWRHEHLVPISRQLKGVLRIGAGSSLFRRDSQWTTFATGEQTPWDVLRDKLFQYPANVARVDARTMSAAKFAVKWEERNVPVLLEHCADDWKAMPNYTDCSENANVWNGCGGQGGWT